MKTELLNKPARHLRIDSSGLLLMCLTFMLGVGAYVLTKPSLPQSAHVNYLIVDLDYRVFGCILCLLLVQLTAFSVIGSVIIGAGLYLRLFCIRVTGYHNSCR